eukprot:TRINITY_DN68068_c3_g3_i3.p1 TRINITY_DN68068_c3_g3~~TRINITY_DN68068_c3_g3_i3.p1  ORF type:complete len:704 (-),score=43.21 TRINITY_DN68068_c3_g3_i3:926-3037(-)
MSSANLLALSFGLGTTDDDPALFESFHQEDSSNTEQFDKTWDAINQTLKQHNNLTQDLQQQLVAKQQQEAALLDVFKDPVIPKREARPAKDPHKKSKQSSQQKTGFATHFNVDSTSERDVHVRIDDRVRQLPVEEQMLHRAANKLAIKREQFIKAYAMLDTTVDEARVDNEPTPLTVATKGAKRLPNHVYGIRSVSKKLQVLRETPALQKGLNELVNMHQDIKRARKGILSRERGNVQEMNKEAVTNWLPQLRETRRKEVVAVREAKHAKAREIRRILKHEKKLRSLEYLQVAGAHDAVGNVDDSVIDAIMAHKERSISPHSPFATRTASELYGSSAANSFHASINGQQNTQAQVLPSVLLPIPEEAHQEPGVVKLTMSWLTLTMLGCHMGESMRQVQDFRNLVLRNKADRKSQIITSLLAKAKAIVKTKQLWHYTMANKKYTDDEKHDAAEIVTMHIRDLYYVFRYPTIVRNFLRKVKMCQKYLRRARVTRWARIALLDMQWERTSVKIAASLRKLIPDRQTQYSLDSFCPPAGGTPKKSKNGTKEKLLDPRAATMVVKTEIQEILSIPRAIRTRVLLADMRLRLCEYCKEVRTYTAIVKEKSGVELEPQFRAFLGGEKVAELARKRAEGLPPHPHFQLILPDDDVKQLVFEGLQMTRLQKRKRKGAEQQADVPLPTLISPLLLENSNTWKARSPSPKQPEP